MDLWELKVRQETVVVLDYPDLKEALEILEDRVLKVYKVLEDLWEDLVLLVKLDLRAREEFLELMADRENKVLKDYKVLLVLLEALVNADFKYVEKCF